MYIRRILLVLTVLLSFVTGAAAQDDCTDLADAAAYASRAAIAYNQRLHDDAVIDYTCAIQLAPDRINYYNARGSAYYWLQRDAEARADYLQVLELDPEAGYAYNNLANIYASIGDYEQAQAYYEQALELPGGRDEITHTNLAIIFMDMGQYEDAQRALDAARSRNPNHDQLHLAQAGLYSIQNNTAQAAYNYHLWLTSTQVSATRPQYTLNRSYVTPMTTGSIVSIALSLNKGDTFSASAAAIDNLQKVDPLIVLIGPNNLAIIADDDSGVNIDAVISDYAVEQTGSYTLLVGNAGGYYQEGVDGRVRISLQRKGPDGSITVEPTPTPQPTLVPTAAPTTAAATSVAPTAEAPTSEDPVEEPTEGEEVTVSFATFRLFVGVVAEVYTTEGDRLNLRSGPGLRFDILGKLDKGAFVTLLEGPRKQDGLAWWKVRTADGAEGWAVERVDTEQTLQMALVAGEDAVVVTGEDTLNVRAGAGRSNAIVVQLTDSQRITLLEVAPTLVDGFQWWRVRLPDGREGWTIDRLDGERMLIPAKERDGEG